MFLQARNAGGPKPRQGSYLCQKRLAVPVDEIETDRGIIIGWLQEKCVSGREALFMVFIDNTFFFRLVCRNGLFQCWKTKLIVLKVFLNLVWSLQDGLWNSMQCSCTETSNGTSTLWHIIFSASPSQFFIQHDKGHLLTRADGRHSTLHVKKQQLSTCWEDSCFFVMIQFSSHTLKMNFRISALFFC